MLAVSHYLPAIRMFQHVFQEEIMLHDLTGLGGEAA